MQPRLTWETKKQLNITWPLMASLRAAGLPLAYSLDADEEDSASSKIVCIAEVSENNIKAIVATPSGLVYKFDCEVFEQSFWEFAAKHYYVVTGNVADRNRFGELSGILATGIKGLLANRKKSTELSGFTLDQILSLIGASTKIPTGEQRNIQANLI